METHNDLIPGFDEITEETLKITLRRIPNVDKGCLISLTGFIDVYNSTFFQKQITRVINSDFYNLIFECSNLSSITSTGFGILTNLLKKVHFMGGEIVLSGLQPTIVETIELLGFAHFFKMVNSLEDAMKEFGAVVAMQNTVFPKFLNCPSCQKVLRAQHSGRFRCINCKTVIVVSDDGNVSVE